MKRRLVVVVLIAIVVSAAVLAGKQGGMSRESGGAADQPGTAQSGAAAATDEPVIRLDQTAQVKSGIEVMPLKPVSIQLQIRSYGFVISPSTLVELRRKCVAASARVQQAQAALKFAEQDYQRTKTLYDKNENASQKVFQAAAETLHEDQAAAEAAKQEFEAERERARQSWGAAIAGWMIDGAPEFGQLMKQEKLLIQLTVPFGRKPFAPPPEAKVQAADGSLVRARFVSISPSTDMRLQGQSLYYLVASQGTTLLPGMSIVAFLATGKPVVGVVVPYSAVVWLRGFARAYFRQGTTEFVRRRISTAQPHQDGWFQPNAAFTNQPVVVQGAQVLLSEALGVKTKSGGGDED